MQLSCLVLIFLVFSALASREKLRNRSVVDNKKNLKSAETENRSRKNKKSQRNHYKGKALWNLNRNINKILKIINAPLKFHVHVSVDVNKKEIAMRKNLELLCRSDVLTITYESLAVLRPARESKWKRILARIEKYEPRLTEHRMGIALLSKREANRQSQEENCLRNSGNCKTLKFLLFEVKRDQFRDFSEVSNRNCCV